jgi:hypothetical protein
MVNGYYESVMHSVRKDSSFDDRGRVVLTSLGSVTRPPTESDRPPTVNGAGLPGADRGTHRGRQPTVTLSQGIARQRGTEESPTGTEHAPPLGSSHHTCWARSHLRSSGALPTCVHFSAMPLRFAGPI